MNDQTHDTQLEPAYIPQPHVVEPEQHGAVRLDQQQRLHHQVLHCTNPGAAKTELGRCGVPVDGRPGESLCVAMSSPDNSTFLTRLQSVASMSPDECILLSIGDSSKYQAMDPQPEATADSHHPTNKA